MSNSIEVLNLIESGKISAVEGLKLIEALRPQQPKATLATGRWLHIRVSDLQSNQQRVNINLPTSWIETGLRIGRKFSPELNEIEWPEILAAVKSGQAGRLLEVEDLNDNQRVEVFVD